MKKIPRRKFIKKSAIISAGSLVSTNILLSAPSLLLKKRASKQTTQGELLFNPYFVQKGEGPHLYNLSWATDDQWDTFLSNINIDEKGVVISDTKGIEKFGINVRWNVEGFGWTNITADNGGEFYTLPPSGKSQELNLNFELCKSRVKRNRSRIMTLMREGWNPSAELMMYLNLSEEFFEDAKKSQSNVIKSAELSQRGLFYALHGSEKMELEKAQFDILISGRRIS
jgi:hypothetical protein